MKINFIPDEVLKLTDDTDLLGTKPYSETIFELINKCEGGKNIGLFGSWGSGKSTILRTLEVLLKENNKSKKEKIAYFEFDAWKYSRDDFRRSFLIELTKKFDVKSEPRLQKLLYRESSYEDPEQTKLKINWLSLPDWIIFFLVVFAFVLLFLPIVGLEDRTKALLSLITISVSLLTKAASNTINKYKVVVKENKIVEPERFESIFDEIVSEVTSSNQIRVYQWIKRLLGKSKYSKVVIVIDNLDRCDDENLLVTLNTIKNFLEHEKVIFILPVDENGISSFLSQKTDNPDEYLRKIFHLIIRIKAFSKKELLEFTHKVNDKYELNLNPSSIRIICQEFTNNPRKIIQFLNNYQSEIWLVSEQSKKGYLNGNFIKKNLSFFIKLLIIKYEWKELYDEILHDKTLLTKINNVITNLEPVNDKFYPIDKTSVKLTDSQRNFLFSTQHIHCAKIDPFILNIDLDKDIPDDVENFIRNGNYSSILNYLNDGDVILDEKSLVKKMGELFSEFTYKHREYEAIALPILGLLIEFISDNTQEDFRSLLFKNHNQYSFLKSLFTNNRIANLFEKFDFEKLTNTVKWFSDNVSDDLFNSFVSHFKTKYLSSSHSDDRNDKIGFFIESFKDTEKLEKIKNSFSKTISAKPDDISEIEALKDYKIAYRVINESTYKKLSKWILDEKNEKTHSISVLCLEYVINNENDIIIRKNLVSYNLNKMQSFHESNHNPNNKTLYVDYAEYWANLNKLLIKKVDIKLTDNQETMFKNLSDLYYKEYKVDFDKNENFELYKLFFQTIKHMIFYLEDFNLITYRTSFFGRYLEINHSSKLSLMINEILQEDVDKHGVYEYPFADVLIKHYEDSKKKNIPYGKTLVLMLEKSKDDKGLSSTQKDEVISRTITVFSFYPSEGSIALMKRLKKSNSEEFLKNLKGVSDIVLGYYIKSVKQLDDNWFYGDSIPKYLRNPIVNSKGTYSNFIKRLGVVSDTFTADETVSFIQELFSYSTSLKSYKWLRLSFKTLPKKAFDVYLDNLISAHENNTVGHNNLFEWILGIPKNKFYKNRLKQYLNYINSLDITHKTYLPKKEKTFEHLSKS